MKLAKIFSRLNIVGMQREDLDSAIARSRRLGIFRDFRSASTVFDSVTHGGGHRQ